MGVCLCLCVCGSVCVCVVGRGDEGLVVPPEAAQEAEEAFLEGWVCVYACVCM